MSTQSMILFKALGAKMDYLSKRQVVISQNIANADTPGYKPHDLKPMDFRSTLKGLTQNGSNAAAVTVNATSKSHIGTSDLSLKDNAEKKQKDTYEVAPVGNAVIIEEQLMNANQTVMDYNLMTNIYQKYINMLRTAVSS